MIIGYFIGGTIITSADNIILSACLGLTIVSIYNNYHYIISSIASFIAILTNSVVSAIGKKMIIDDVYDNYKLFKRLSFAFTWIISWATITFICLANPFVSIWVGEERTLSTITIVLFGLYFYFWQVRIILATYKDACGKWKLDFWKPYIAVVVNIILNIVLVKVIGLNGILVSTIFVFAFIYFPWESWAVVVKIFDQKLFKHYFRYLMFFVVFVLSATITYYVCDLVTIAGILGLIIRLIICLILPNIIILCFYFKTDEFRYYFNRLKMIFKREG